MSNQPKVYKSIEDVPEELRPYTVTHKGEPKYFLNRELAIRQGVKDYELKNLLSLHEEKLDLFEKMESLDPVEDKEKLRKCVMEFEGIELGMQANWHFPQDENFHEWYTVPHCTCPVLDNRERRGTSHRVISKDCPVHS